MICRTNEPGHKVTSAMPNNQTTIRPVPISSPFHNMSLPQSILVSHPTATTWNFHAATTLCLFFPTRTACKVRGYGTEFSLTCHNVLAAPPLFSCGVISFSVRKLTPHREMLCSCWTAGIPRLPLSPHFPSSFIEPGIWDHDITSEAEWHEKLDCC